MINLSEDRQELQEAWLLRLLRYVKLCFTSIITFPLILFIVMNKNRDLVFADARRWARLCDRKVPVNSLQHIGTIINLIDNRIEYRTLLYLRLGIAGRLLGLFVPRMSTIAINCKSIGPGFFLRHGHGTLISAISIGENCTVHQLVTIGYGANGSRAKLGNNVTIYPAATIIGGVFLGDNCTVGANSLVLSDVPAGATVVGVPARVVTLSKPQAPSENS